MKSKAARALLLVLPIAFVACSGGEKAEAAPPPEPMSQAGADAMRGAFVNTYMMKNAEGAADFYADSAVMVGPDGTVTTGKAAITEAFKSMIAAGQDSLGMTSTSFEAGGDSAIDRGTWIMRTLDPQTKEATRANGTYMVKFERQPAGAFKIVLDSVIPAAK